MTYPAFDIDERMPPTFLLLMACGLMTQQVQSSLLLVWMDLPSSSLDPDRLNNKSFPLAASTAEAVQ